MAVVLLEDAKLFLNVTSNTQDYEIARFLQSAEGIVEGWVGPMASTVKTDTVYAPTSLIVLRFRPVLSVQSVQAAGLDDTDNWALDPAAGVLRRTGYQRLPYAALTISYTAGRSPVPPELETAVLFVLEQMWQSQRGPSPSQDGPLFANRSAADVHEFPRTAGSLVPPRALEAMRGHLLPSGVA